MIKRALLTAVVCIWPLLAVSGWADEPENERLPGKAFRRGLKQLGLNDLLGFYIREFPPNDGQMHTTAVVNALLIIDRMQN